VLHGRTRPGEHFTVEKFALELSGGALDGEILFLGESGNHVGSLPPVQALFDYLEVATRWNISWKDFQLFPAHWY
jgi:hypothetical protein